jgi:hypothetical protein
MKCLKVGILIQNLRKKKYGPKKENSERTNHLVHKKHLLNKKQALLEIKD